MTDQPITLFFIVPTPIGNLDDITIRAINTLKNVDLILAEDTRKSGLLLKHYDIQKPLQSYHIFNEQKIIDGLIKRMKNGEKMALISDAGTPAISDPGFLISRACIQNSIPMECLPGPTAFVPALIKSALPADNFVFEGFLPHKKGRTKKLESLREEHRTMIFYESPHRLLKTLYQFAAQFGDNRQASVSRELTKKFEETINDTLGNLIFHFENNPIKGEFVIVVAGKKTKPPKK